jgi:transcriptional regulator with XRE-family HTH domain
MLIEVRQGKMRTDRLKHARQLVGHTQESLAQLIGKDVKQLWRWESGKVVPSADILVDIAVALDVSADYLLGLSDEPLIIRDSSLSSLETRAIALIRTFDEMDQDMVVGLIENMQMHFAQRGRTVPGRNDDHEMPERRPKVNFGKPPEKANHARSQPGDDDIQVYSITEAERQIEAILQRIPDKKIGRSLLLCVELVYEIATANPFTASTDQMEDFLAWFDPLDMLQHKLSKECDKRGIDVDINPKWKL